MNFAFGLVTWLCCVTQKQTALPLNASWLRQSHQQGRCAAEPRNEFLARKEKSVSGEFWWIIGVMLTASLVAPFWYDAISGISSVAQRAHAARKAARE